MRSFSSMLSGILPFVIFPYSLIVLFVICYYTVMKYRIWRVIRNICYPLTIGIDRNKFKLNLQIKSMMYNFILILSITELSAKVLLQLSQISRFDFNLKLVYWQTISNSCVIQSMDMIDLLHKSTFVLIRAQNIGIIIMTMFPILMSLFFVILRHMYLNHPYNACIRKYIVYIILQFVVKTALACFMQTWYISQLLYFPLGVFDVRVYIATSHKYYLLLKGRKDEAQRHSTKADFIKKIRIVNRFFLNSGCYLNCFLYATSYRLYFFRPSSYQHSKLQSMFFVLHFSRPHT